MGWVTLMACVALACDEPRAPTPRADSDRGPDAAAAEAAAPESHAAEPAPTRPATFADVVEATRPAVVNIYTRQKIATKRYLRFPDRRFVPRERLAESLGSGFIIDEEGHVLTNFHVVRNATDIEVRLFDDRRFSAELVGEDPKTDLALLKIVDAQELPTLEFADSEALRVGDWVVAIGNPLGLTSTVTAGIVSATGRGRLPLGELRFQDFIQTDASINPGNSGGPLLDLEGQVVGINTAVNPEGQGIGFAIPAHMALEMLPRLKQGGRVQRSWLGIYVDPVPAALRTQLGLPEEGGALVRKTVPGGPAAAADLREGDVILTVGADAVEGADHLAWLAGNVGVGKTVALQVQRGADRLTVSLTLGALPD